MTWKKRFQRDLERVTIALEEEVEDDAVNRLKIKTTTRCCLLCTHARDELIKSHSFGSSLCLSVNILGAVYMEFNSRAPAL